MLKENKYELLQHEISIMETDEKSIVALNSFGVHFFSSTAKHSPDCGKG
jgi:hypothetical protein